MTTLLRFAVALCVAVLARGADVVPKTVTADTTTHAIVWPTNFFVANSNLINAVADTTSIVPIIRGGSGASSAAGARLAWGLDSAAPGSAGTNILVSATPGAVRVILGLDEGSPGEFGTNLLTIATAAEARALLGLNEGAPGAMGTNLLTAVSASAARTLLDVVARDGGASTNQQALNPTLSFKVGLGSLQFSDSVGDAQTILSNQLNAASVAWPVLFDYSGVAATNLEPRDQDVLNLATGKRAFVLNAGGFATNISVVVSGKSSPEDFTLLGAAGTNYFGFGYVSDGSKMGPKLRTLSGDAFIIDDVAEDDVLNYGSMLRVSVGVSDTIAALGAWTKPHASMIVRGEGERGVFALLTNATVGLYKAPALITAAGTGTLHKMKMQPQFVTPGKYRNNGAGYVSGAATVTCGTNNVPVTITVSSGAVVTITPDATSVSTTTPIMTDLPIVQAGGSNGTAIVWSWLPSDYTVVHWTNIVAGSGYTNGPCQVLVHTELVDARIEEVGGSGEIVAIETVATSIHHYEDTTTAFAVIQGAGVDGTVQQAVTPYLRYVSGGTGTPAQWAPRSISNGVLLWADITYGGEYSELPGASPDAVRGRYMRDVTTTEYWPNSTAPTFRAWVPGLGGTLVPFAGGSGFWSRVYGSEVNPLWFGAVNDGVTTNNYALQAAGYTAVQEQARLYLPPLPKDKWPGADGAWLYPPSITNKAGFKIMHGIAEVPVLDWENILTIHMDSPVVSTTSRTNAAMRIGSGTNITVVGQNHTKLWSVYEGQVNTREAAHFEVAGFHHSKAFIFNCQYGGAGWLVRPRSPLTDSKNASVTVGRFHETFCNVLLDNAVIHGTPYLGGESDEWCWYGGEWGLRNPIFTGGLTDWSDDKVVADVIIYRGQMSQWKFMNCMWAGRGPLLYTGMGDQGAYPAMVEFNFPAIDGKAYVAATPFIDSRTNPSNMWYANFLLMSPTNATYNRVDFRNASQPGMIFRGLHASHLFPTIVDSTWKGSGILIADSESGSLSDTRFKQDPTVVAGPPVKTSAGYVAFPKLLAFDCEALTKGSSHDWPQLIIDGTGSWMMPGNSYTTSGKMVDKMWGVEVFPRSTNCIISVGGMSLGELMVMAWNRSGVLLSNRTDVFGAYHYTNFTASGKPYYTMLAGAGDVFLSTNVHKAWIGFGRNRGMSLDSNLIQLLPSFKVTAGAADFVVGDEIPRLPAAPDGAIMPIGAQVRDATYPSKMWQAGSIVETTLTTPLTNGVAVTSIVVASTSGMAAGDVLEIETDRLGNLVTYYTSAKPISKRYLTHTIISSVDSGTTLTVASVTPSYSSESGLRVRSQSRTMRGVEMKTFTQPVPKNLNTALSGNPAMWFAVEASTYKNGITITKMKVTKSDNTTSYTTTLKEYTSPSDGSPVNIETITSSAYEAEDTTIANPLIEAGNMVYVQLPATDIGWVTVQIEFVRN